MKNKKRRKRKKKKRKKKRKKKKRKKKRKKTHLAFSKIYNRSIFPLLKETVSEPEHSHPLPR